MTTKQIIKLVLKSRRYTKEEIFKVIDELLSKDAIQYIIWLEKLLCVELYPILA